MAILTAVLAASLLGSLHCAGMCGPLVVFAMGSTEVRSHRGRFAAQLAYHGGRLVTYTAIGIVCGSLGATLDLGGTLLGLRPIAGLLAGGTMVLVGVVAVLRYWGVRMPRLPSLPLVTNWIQKGHRSAMQLQPLSRALVTGSLTAFLPCGWLYAFAIIATGTASPVMGGAVMASFWVGTVPVLASLGVGVQTLTGTLGRRLPLATALLVTGLGLYSIAGRMTIPAQAFESPDVSTAKGSTMQQIQSASETPPACCCEHR